MCGALCDLHMASRFTRLYALIWMFGDMHVGLCIFALLSKVFLTDLSLIDNAGMSGKLVTLEGHLLMGQGFA